MKDTDRFKEWAATQGCQVEDLEIPEGTIGLVLDIIGNDGPEAQATRTSIIMDPAGLPEFIDKMSFIGALPFNGGLRIVAKYYRDGLKMAEPAREATLGVAAGCAIWLAYHHPSLGSEVRAKVAQCFRQHGRALITWYLHPQRGFAVSVGEKYVDMEAAMRSYHQSGVRRPMIFTNEGEPERPLS